MAFGDVVDGSGREESGLAVQQGQAVVGEEEPQNVHGSGNSTLLPMHVDEEGLDDTDAGDDEVLGKG